MKKLIIILFITCNNPIEYECGITEPKSTYDAECDCLGIVDSVLTGTYQCIVNDSTWLILR